MQESDSELLQTRLLTGLVLTDQGATIISRDRWMPTTSENKLCIPPHPPGVYSHIWAIERFHSRGQQPCKFFGTKESFYIRKEFNSQRISLEHQHGRRFIVLEHQYGCRDVMWKRSIAFIYSRWLSALWENIRSKFYIFKPLHHREASFKNDWWYIQGCLRSFYKY